VSLRATPKHVHAARLIRRSILEVYAEIGPLLLTDTLVPVPVLSLARLLVERIDCQLACLLDKEPITASTVQSIMWRADFHLSRRGLPKGRARIRCAAQLRPNQVRVA